jgi:peptidoglycan LD-endopeptidase LytH
MKIRTSLLILLGIVALVLVGVAFGGRRAIRWWSESQSNSNPYIQRWFDEPLSRASLTNLRDDACPASLFILPSDGLIGLLWEDPAGPYTVFSPHTGLDIFGDGEPGTVPVYAAYDGYLSRLSEWVSTVIIRHDDPLQEGRVIWTYYTHMASREGTESFIDAAFPLGTEEVWVEQGALLGYQGEYGGAGVPIGMHVHFSIVLSDEDGTFANESRLSNTLDPSPYFDMSLTTPDFPTRPIACD